jgi:prepilin-type N-terminal cleavage/methylation domain-containing protein
VRRRGLTLIELMVVIAITVILVFSITFAYSTGIRFQSQVTQTDAQLRRVARFEETIRQVLEGAYLSTDESDPDSCFMTLASGGDLANPDTLVFTTLGLPPTNAYIQASDEFEVLNERFGPQGGLAEVSLSLLPVGTPPTESATTLYLRVQRPPDGDMGQGGLERALADTIESVSFEFFDGTQWLTEWNTQTGQRRLPAAVRVTYLVTDEDDERTLTVRLPHSDVTPENPLLQEIGT